MDIEGSNLMKIRIEIDKDQDEEIIIKCNSITERINNIQRFIEYESIDKKIKLFKDNIEYYIDLKSILFFETDDLFVSAHTKDNVFQAKYKLYELENTLPNYFVRVSKSAILNINHIYSINRNITSSSTVIFNNTYKKVYVSRMYYKLLKQKMEGRIFNEN